VLGFDVKASGRMMKGSKKGREISADPGHKRIEQLRNWLCTAKAKKKGGKGTSNSRRAARAGRMKTFGYWQGRKSRKCQQGRESSNSITDAESGVKSFRKPGEIRGRIEQQQATWAKKIFRAHDGMGA